MKNILCLFCFILKPIFGLCQDTEFILDNYYKAIGGKSKIDSVESYSLTYSGTIDEKKFTGSFFNQRPFLFRYEISNPETGDVTLMCFDGKESWMYDNRVGKDSFRPHEKFPNIKARGLHSQNFMNYLIDISKNGYKCKIVGQEKIDSLECFKLRLTNIERNMQIDCYIDKTNFLLRKEVFSDLDISEDDPKKTITEINYLKYIWVEGILMPENISRITTTKLGKMVSNQNYSDYKINSIVEKYFFECHPNPK